MEQSVSYKSLLIGPALGFLSFCVGLVTLEGVLIRQDSDGNNQLRLDNVWEYIKLPFDPKKYETAWGLIPGIPLITRLKLLNLNWVAMVGLGTIGSFIYYYYKY